MKKTIILSMLILCMVATSVFAADTTTSFGGTIQLDWWQNIKEFKPSQVNDKIQDKDYSFGVDLTFFNYQSTIFGIWGNAALLFPQNKILNSDMLLDFNLGPAFRIPFGNILALQFGIGANVKTPTHFKNALIGLGSTATLQVGLGKTAALLTGVNLSYNFYDVVQKQQVTFLTLRPFVGIGFRTGNN